jgi:hypothetical protein
MFFISLTACGGGGGSAGGTSNAAPSSGSVAVLLADGPLDDLAALNLLITKVSLLPAGNGREVVIYENGSGLEVDILQYRDVDYMLTLKQDVPAGRYEKIRLEIADVTAEAKKGAEGTCAELEIKLPSGKIDLNPRGGFTVAGGETLAIRLDIDARKSIQLHQAGNSGKCIFRPVIFVDIDTVFDKERCPSVFKGQIVRFLFEENSNTRIGFVLDLKGGRGTVKVLADSETVFFDENADSEGVDLTDLTAGDVVHVRGSLTSDGKLLASLVVAGDVLKLEGTVAKDADAGSFNLTLDPKQAILSSSLTVHLEDQTLILIGCDESVDAGYILADSRVTVIGKYSTEKQALLAVAVIIKAREIAGNLETLVPVGSEGFRLGVRAAGGTLKEIILPAGEPFYLEGDGVVSFQRLTSLLACGKTPAVRVLLDPAIASPQTAKKAFVVPERVEGTVTVVDAAEGKLTLSSGSVIALESGATLLKNQAPVLLSSIQPGDEVAVFGLSACSDDTAVDFFGYILIVDPID